MKEKLGILFFILIINCEEVEVTNVSGGSLNQKEYPCLSDASNCLDSIKVKGGSFNFYSSFSLDSVNNVYGAIICTHGATRNGDDYFNRMVTLVKEMNLESEILIIAPQFITLYDKENDTDWYWNTTSWKWGNQSYMSNSGLSVSSFEVIDSLLSRVNINNGSSSFSTVLITGHSSGAAFAHTYAATKTNNRFKSLSVDFAVVNNQYYLYPDSNRLLNQSLYLPSNCINYNDWPLGFADSNPYIENIGIGAAKQNIIQNKVDYFIGSNDVQTSDMTSGCGYSIIGEHRLEKTVNYNVYMDLSFENNQHTYTTIQGVGHNSTGMFFSQQFKNYLNALF